MTSVLFVCLGNICRSPMAEGLLKKRIADAGMSHRFRIDSARMKLDVHLIQVRKRS